MVEAYRKRFEALAQFTEDALFWTEDTPAFFLQSVIAKSICLLAIDAFSEIDIIEDDLLLGFIYLVDYPILPHSVFPETFQFTDESHP
jgi:hypothetical protein